MLAKVIIYAALFATSALGAAVPASTDVSVDMGDAVALAEQRGIDVHGPIPADATPIDGGFSFKADSKAAFWVRAQGALSASGKLAKREDSGMSVGMFVSSLCRGDGVFINNVKFDFQNIGPSNDVYNSVTIGGRGVFSNEQLDFSTRSGNDRCAIFKKSFHGVGTGCYTNEGITCFRLIHQF